MRKITILGSTGSIGKQTLEVIREQKNIEVVALTANQNIDLLEQQILEFNPKCVVVMDEKKAQQLQKKIGHKTEVLWGMDGLITVATLSEINLVVTAVVGMIGLRPTIAAIKSGKDIALANKETLVTAGAIIMDLVKKHKVQLLPVDSEHSAIFQCLDGAQASTVASIILTASGGPFRGYSKERLEEVTLEQALKHPNWSMGAKITIDSSTLVNKGLEVIEAKWLFDLRSEQIQVVVHPQSIVHSMVEFIDGSIIAQMGLPDMKLPIQYALAYPDRVSNSYPRLKLSEIGILTFEEPDLQVFKGLGLAYDALKEGGSMPIVYNAANESAVDMFLKREIQYNDIVKIIENAMLKHDVAQCTDETDVIEIESWTRNIVRNR
ncbi:1-deoxy-D-xylulose-5-phosphate reductoisomerase [Petrocella atlantisensis]|uniref:1-deoxy-D-xylulose 5-phosphate reductoisomerase n=1 Tax=Petrocella atlantisensis TaxID=2173034 RepID=A0A3P7RTT0_9FIRM|nr:1-deoxy-D-xylulose-5-phosphate reductoisomerase [Petrocella atlantisensis]VDN46282.1 1-deoxy-D-xylulose-5-phosphate reductoisomerase [Petrocella atlantisensis]